jgi:ABC-type sulfate/molybdate transport systems ATPase subunit
LQGIDVEHAEFYFWRDGETQRLLEKLKTDRFVAVLGPSGSGKSSLMRAGLLPALLDG